MTKSPVEYQAPFVSRIPAPEFHPALDKISGRELNDLYLDYHAMFRAWCTSVELRRCSSRRNRTENQIRLHHDYVSMTIDRYFEHFNEVAQKHLGRDVLFRDRQGVAA